ncbi:uncharacterized protein LOC124455921 isoform X2 [Xenia sp. Carnegie-2017]|uniref:uncharacterized protein LOC124455921 isoform X2 n=1 Tax=Xenia sp. Carnegie-2017 TaxID=2897299 RepID=UPI001F04EC4A|nr:uncharacterized protein LOC124455921 isoform X2 [Xenia sp. Carnegie-2017]
MAARNLNSENTDNVHIDRDASDKVAIMSLPLGIEETKNFGTAIANEKFIKEVGELLKQMGQALKDDYDLPQTEELRNFQERFSGFIQKVFSTVGIVLDWLEASAANAKVKDNRKKHANVDKTNTQDQLDYPDGNVENDGQFEKKENVLRGLYHIVVCLAWVAVHVEWIRRKGTFDPSRPATSKFNLLDKSNKFEACYIYRTYCLSLPY